MGYINNLRREVAYVDGVRYYRQNNVYYRSHFGGGYEVVRMRKRHDEGRHRGDGHGRDRW